MSAACSHVRAPLSARKMTSCIFIARSTAAAAKTIGTSLGAYGCSPVRPQSGHFTCSRERTDHVLPTARRRRVDHGTSTRYRWRGVRYPNTATIRRGRSIGTWTMLGDSPSHVSLGPPEPVAPVRDAAQETADELQL